MDSFGINCSTELLMISASAEWEDDLASEGPIANRPQDVLGYRVSPYLMSSG